MRKRARVGALLHVLGAFRHMNLESETGVTPGRHRRPRGKRRETSKNNDAPVKLVGEGLIYLRTRLYRGAMTFAIQVSL